MTQTADIAHTMMEKLGGHGIISVVGLASAQGMEFSSIAIGFRYGPGVEMRLDIMSNAAINSVLTTLLDEAKEARSAIAVWKTVPAWSDDPVDGESGVTRRLLSARVAFISPDELHRRLTESRP